MPPKASIRNRRSQPAAPELIPIYDMLSDQQSENPVRQAIKKLQYMSKHEHYNAIERSIMVLIMQTCGLSKWICGINWRQDYSKDLAELISQIPQQYHSRKNKKKNDQKNQFFLLNLKSKFHTQFKKRLQKFFQTLLSDQLGIIQQTNTMKMVFDVLREISKCKLRNIRASSIQIVSIVVNKSCFYYEQMIEARNSKKAAKLLTIIEQGYLDTVIKPRMKDIDTAIRQKAFSIIEQSFKNLQLELIVKEKLSNIFMAALTDNSSKVTQLTLRTLKSLLQMRDAKDTTIDNLCKFSKKYIPILQQIALLPNNNGCLAMRCLSSTNKLKQNLQVLKPRTICKIFQIYGYEQYHEGLKVAVDLFCQSLVNYKDIDEIYKHPQTIIVEITHLLSSIHSQKLIKIILQEFLSLHHQIFSFENIFVLISSEYYRESQVDIQFQSNQIALLLTMAVQLNKYIANLSRKSKNNNKWVENQIQSYNKCVLQNCKQIFYDKLTNSRNYQNSYLFLSLFSHIFMQQLDSSYQKPITFVIDKVLDILKQQKYVIMGNEDIIRMNRIVKQCINIYYHLNGQKHLSNLLQAMGVDLIVNKGEFDPIDVIKFTNLSALYNNIPNFYQKPFLKKTINCFTNNHQEFADKTVRLLLLTFLKTVHINMFKQLFQAPNSALYQDYISFRDAFMELITVMILNNPDENGNVKLGAFSAFCHILRYVSNNKLAITGTMYYEINQRQLQVLLQYVECNFLTELQLFNEIFEHSQRREQEENDIAKREDIVKINNMMSNIGLNTQEIKQKVLEDLFLLFQDCHKIAMKSVPFIIKLQLLCLNSGKIQQNLTTSNANISLNNIAKNANLLFMQKLKKFFNNLIRTETHSQYKNKFVYWRFFSEFLKQAQKYDINQKKDSMQVQGEQEDESKNQPTIAEQIIDDLLSRYFKYKQKSNTDSSKILSDKLMLYIADYVDKTINNYIGYCSLGEEERKNIQLDKIHLNIVIIKQMLKRVKRRYPKQVLHRLNVFLNNKIQGLSEDKQIKSLKKYLNKISEIGQNTKKSKRQKKKKTDKEENQEDQSQDDNSIEQQSQRSQNQEANDSQEEENMMKNQNVRRSERIRNQKSVSKKKNQTENRNRTKKKVR